VQHLVESIASLYREWKGVEPDAVDVLPQSGSERRYFRLKGPAGSVIGTYGANHKENDTFIYFIYFSHLFKERGLAVPKIEALSKDGLFYLQEDFGDVSLLNRLEAEGFTDNIYELKVSITAVASPIVNLENRRSWPICFISNTIFLMPYASLTTNKS
jgi:hypothetical protein